VATRYVAQLFEAVGVDRVVTLDVHNVTAYQNAFRCPAEHLEAAPVFVGRLAAGLEGLPVAVVSPDSGGVKRADDFRRRLAARVGRDIDLAFVEKHRSEGVVSGDAFAGDVEGKVALVVDDLIASGTTMARAASACLAAGAVKVVAVATHGVFSPEANDVLVHSEFEGIYVTDSVPHSAVCGPQLAARLVKVSVAPLIGEAIARLHDGRSLVDLGADQVPCGSG
jgi:ribose-phosphate pyrophosphokinase